MLGAVLAGNFEVEELGQGGIGEGTILWVLGRHWWLWSKGGLYLGVQAVGVNPVVHTSIVLFQLAPLSPLGALS